MDQTGKRGFQGAQRPLFVGFRRQFPARSENLKRIYGIERIPEDTALREGPDGIARGSRVCPLAKRTPRKWSPRPERGGKIENETFNTLKNQGCHLEHNYGHSAKYLATNFAVLTFLAFLTDQIAQALDSAFQKALAQNQSVQKIIK
jgi:hypothetical protein